MAEKEVPIKLCVKHLYTEEVVGNKNETCLSHKTTRDVIERGFMQNVSRVKLYFIK